MATLDDPGVQRLLNEPHYAVASTLNEDGSIHSTIVWVDLLDGDVAVNSAVGRKWPTNLEHNPTITVLVYDEKDPYHYLEVRGTAKGTTEGADAHIDRLASKYTGQETYPFRRAGEQRISFRVEPTLVRHQKPA